MSILTALLQNKEQLINEIFESTDLKRKNFELIIISSIAFCIYGFIIGLNHSLVQAISAGIKLPIFYGLTLLICVPTLFIFSSFFGSKLSIPQTISIGLSSTCIMSILLLGFAPVVLFFEITANNYQFFKLLNVGFFIISGFFGVKFLYYSMRQIIEKDNEGQRARKRIIFYWILLYGFVASQMGWTLRPFFGYSNLPFEIIREVNSNFYADIIKSVGHILGFH